MLYGNPARPPSKGPCCFIPCDAEATWRLQYGPAPDDDTLSCDAHVSALLGDSPLLNITSLTPPVVDHLDFVIDGPPGPTGESGRFVELEGFYGSFAPKNIEGVGGEVIKWIEDDDGHWRLRVPIRGGSLYG